MNSTSCHCCGNQGTANKFEELLKIKKDHAVAFSGDSWRLALCPDLGGRVFAEVCGEPMHRIDLPTVLKPDQPFNNYGGGNFWPAPEGGKFGWNYRGNEWYVQESINRQPFRVVDAQKDSASIQKQLTLRNRAETLVEAMMARTMKIEPKLPAVFDGARLCCGLSYRTVDTFEALNRVAIEQALLGAWTLEQFEASDHTVAFCAVENPREAINFDFYDHPGERIKYYSKGFTYKVDGKAKGQVGLPHEAKTSLIGFYDLSRKLVCIRENRSSGEGLFFNFADNDQPEGPFSASDDYSIFNSDADMKFFELETIGSAKVSDSLLKGSELITVTTFAHFEEAQDITRFVHSLIGE